MNNSAKESRRYPVRKSAPLTRKRARGETRGEVEIAKKTTREEEISKRVSRDTEV